MEYKQGLDRVGDNTHFPFPIKLEHDESNVYLTPLLIPETSSVLVVKDKITKQPINLLDANELGNLWLCLEVADGKNEFYRPGYYSGKNIHPRRGGKFHLKGHLMDYFPNNLILGREYVIPIRKGWRKLFGRYKGARIAKHFGKTKGFGYIRGTFRYGASIYTHPQRTGIYSNIEKIEFNIDF